MHIPDSLVSFCNSVGRIPAMHLISRSYFISHGLTKVRNHGGGRNTHPWRGKENFDQCGSYLSLSDPDIFGTSTPNYPSFQHHQREANRCIEIELHPPSAGIVRSSVGVFPRFPSVGLIDAAQALVSSTTLLKWTGDLGFCVWCFCRG